MNRGILLLLAALVASLSFALAAQAAPGAQQEPPSDEPPAEETCDPDDPDDPDCYEPRIYIIGTGGSGASGAGVSFNWDGPGRLDYGIYDHGCMNYADEFRYLVNANRSLIGSVAPQTVSWQATLDTVRARLEGPTMKAGYEAANELAGEKANLDAKGVAATLALGDPKSALAQLFAAVEKSPDDPGRLFNFAAALSQNGFANEALAVIARIRQLDMLPGLPLGVNADAALDYQAGYAEMHARQPRRGQVELPERDRPRAIHQ